MRLSTSTRYGPFILALLFACAASLATPLFADNDLERDLPGKLEMVPLWDGKTLDGWEAIGGGEWKIEEGAIHGVSSKNEKKHGHLITKESYRDFVIALEFQALQGNSGLYFRVERAAPLGVKGFQAEIDDNEDVGGLYETSGRGWVVQPTPDQVKGWFLPGEWNNMTVVALGGDITVYVNGQKSARVLDDPGRAEGQIALQLHGGQDMDVRFRDIRIAELEEDTDEAEEAPNEAPTKSPPPAPTE